MGRIHLFEPNLSGHRPFYLRWLLTGRPADLPCTVHAPAAAVAHPALSDLSAAARSGLDFVTMEQPDAPPPSNALQLVRHHWRKATLYAAEVRKHRLCADDVVFIPYVDDAAYALALRPGLLGPPRVVAVGMRADFHFAPMAISTAQPRSAAWKRWLALRLLSRPRLHTYLTNQLPLKQHIDAAFPELAEKTVFLPDPAETSEPVGRDVAGARLGLDSRRRHVLLFGGLTLRKGVRRICALLARSDWPAEATVVLAGRCDADVRALIDAPSMAAARADGRLIVRAGVVTTADENLLYQAADVVWLVYEQHDFMSGCQVTAGMHARPMVACRDGLMGWYNREFDLGPTVAPGDDDAYALTVLRRCWEDSAWAAAAGARGRTAFAAHTVAAFADTAWVALRRAAH